MSLDLVASCNYNHKHILKTSSLNSLETSARRCCPFLLIAAPGSERGMYFKTRSPGSHVALEIPSRRKISAITGWFISETMASFVPYPQPTWQCHITLHARHISSQIHNRLSKPWLCLLEHKKHPNSNHSSRETIPCTITSLSTASMQSHNHIHIHRLRPSFIHPEPN